MTQNALIRKNGEFIVKDQIIFQYAKPITAQEVKQQVSYFLGKKSIKNTIEVKMIDANKHVFLIAAKGAHLLKAESVAKGFVKGGPIPPPPNPIIPSQILLNSLQVIQQGLKLETIFRVASLRQ